MFEEAERDYNTLFLDDFLSFGMFEEEVGWSCRPLNGREQLTCSLSSAQIKNEEIAN